MQRIAVIFVLLFALAACAVPRRSASNAASSGAAPAPTGTPIEQAIRAPTGTPMELAIIVNKANPTDNLSLAELREYFMAERGHWPNGQGKVRVVMLEPGNPEREAALRLIYDMNEKGFTSYFLGKKFRGETLEEPRQQSSPTTCRYDQAGARQRSTRASQRKGVGTRASRPAPSSRSVPASKRSTQVIRACFGSRELR